MVEGPERSFRERTPDDGYGDENEEERSKIEEEGDEGQAVGVACRCDYEEIDEADRKEVDFPETGNGDALARRQDTRRGGIAGQGPHHLEVLGSRVFGESHGRAHTRSATT
jgi:hypothetical protein